MTDTEVLEMLGTDPADCRDQLAGLSRYQLAGLSGGQLAGLSGDQLAGLSGDQLAGQKELDASTPTLEKPYSTLLANTKNCAVNFDMGAWHCQTTHCAAGWIVTQAGMEGAALEQRFDTPTAARLILRKSCPADWPLPNFYASNDAAAAFIRKMAALEAAQ